MKLEVGMYVRTIKGICRIKGFASTLYEDYIENEKGSMIPKEDIIKASHNIIDLIEVGDYVNGYKVYYCYCGDEDSTGLYIDTEKGRVWLDKPSQIKSIVTKEQFSQMEYKVVE